MNGLIEDLIPTTMKNLQSKGTPKGWKAVCPVLFSLLVLCLGACSKIKTEEVVKPDPFAQAIGNLVLDSDTLGQALLSIKSLKLDQSKPFSFSSKDFQHGDFDLQGDSALVFIPIETKTWQADSGIVHVTQEGRSKDGFVKIINRAYKAPSFPVVWLKGTPVPDMSPIYLDPGDSRNLTNLIGMEEPGAEIDSIWGFIYTASIKADKVTITYLAMGGIGNFLNFGTDHIYYRVKRPNELYFRGMIPVFIGDTAQPMAQNDEWVVGAQTGFISWTTLMANDNGSNPALPRLPTSMRLEPLSYSGNKRILTQFGTINDTLQGGNPAFFYKRLATGNQPDTTFIFLQEGPENRITRSRLIVKTQ